MKSTRRSLLLSTLSLLLCITMLVGTTFAWFTDSVTSGVNRIVAGNLDVDVLYTKDGTTWNNLQDSPSLFSTNLWEPGHTEYVTLKIVNKGTLAFNYRMNVSPVNETAGINVDGQGFKLSDYLVFHTTAPANEPTVYATREEARAAAGTTMKLNQSGLTQNGTLLAKTVTDTDYPAHYVTLAVYMPETVGNEANYMTGTTPPFIELGIKVFAYQEDYEEDSFDEKYDLLDLVEVEDGGDNTVYMEPVKYTLKQQDVVSKTIKANENTVFTSTVTPAGTIAETTTITIPAGTKNFDADDVAAMKVVANPVLAANKTFTISSNGAVGAIDLKVTVNDEPVTQFLDENDQPQLVKVETYVAKNMTNVSLSYNDTETWATQVSNESDVDEVGELWYDKISGKLVYMTTHFSTFVLGANEVAYIEETNMAYSIEDAFTNVNSGQTITLLKNYKYASSPSYVYSQRTVYKIDLNGYILDMNNSSYGLYVLKGQTVTINDSNGTGALKNKQCVVYMVDGSNLIVNGGYLGGVTADQATIYGYGHLTVNGGKVDVAKKSGYDFYGVFVGNSSNNNTPASFILTGGEVNGGIYINGQDTENNTITITGGVMNGKSYVAGNNKTVITGGTFAGTTCFCFKSGDISISGGTFTANKGDGDWKHMDSAFAATGDAVIFEACSYPTGNLAAHITGGTFSGFKAEGGTAETSGNIFFKNYGILVINYAGDAVNMTGTTVPYRMATVASNTDEKYVTSNSYIHFTDDNTTLVTP